MSTHRSLVLLAALTTSALATWQAFAGTTLNLPATGTGDVVSGSGLTVKNTANFAGAGNPRPFAITGIGSGATAGGIKGETTKNNGIALYGTATGPGSYGVYVINTGGGYGALFELEGPQAGQSSNSALKAINSQGSTTSVGDYGSAGFFETTNTNNLSDVVHINGNAVGNALTAIISGSTTESISGNAVSGQDYTSNGGFAVSGNSQNGYSAYFAGGFGGNGICYYDGSSGWTCPSDRNLKEHFATVDLGALLDRLDAMPVFTYQMKRSKRPTRYLGPTAQDFRAAFDLGENNTTINTANAQGVALAAAKGLYRKLKADEAEIAALKKENAKIAALEARLAVQDAAMAELKAAVARLAQDAGGTKQASLTTH